MVLRQENSPIAHHHIIFPTGNDRDDWISALRAAVRGLGTSTSSFPTPNGLDGGEHPAVLAPITQGGGGGTPTSVVPVAGGTPNLRAPALAGGTPDPHLAGGTPNLQAPVLGTPGTSSSRDSFPQFPSLSPGGITVLSDSSQQSPASPGPHQQSSPGPPHFSQHGRHASPPATSPPAKGLNEGADGAPGVNAAAAASVMNGTPNAAAGGTQLHGSGAGGAALMASTSGAMAVSGHAGGDSGSPQARARGGMHVHEASEETLMAASAVSGHADDSGSPQKSSEALSAGFASGGGHDAFPVSFDDSGEGFVSSNPSSQIIGERRVGSSGKGSAPSSADRRVAVSEADRSVAVEAYARKTFELRVRVREGVDLAVRGPMALFEEGLQGRLETFYSGHKRWPLSKATHPQLEPIHVSQHQPHEPSNAQTLNPQIHKFSKPHNLKSSNPRMLKPTTFKRSNISPQPHNPRPLNRSTSQLKSPLWRRTSPLTLFPLPISRRNDKT